LTKNHCCYCIVDDGYQDLDLVGDFRVIASKLMKEMELRELLQQIFFLLMKINPNDQNGQVQYYLMIVIIEDVVFVF